MYKNPFVYGGSLVRFLISSLRGYKPCAVFRPAKHTLSLQLNNRGVEVFRFLYPRIQVVQRTVGMEHLLHYHMEVRAVGKAASPFLFQELTCPNCKNAYTCVMDTFLCFIFSFTVSTK